MVSEVSESVEGSFSWTQSKDHAGWRGAGETSRTMLSKGRANVINRTTPPVCNGITPNALAEQFKTAWLT
jgi:hypothetical protein